MRLGFLDVLTLIFVVAKLFGFINWSWWLVFAPSLFGFGVALLIIVLACLLPGE